MQTQEFAAALGEAQGYSGSVKRGQLWALMDISFFRPEKKSPNRWNLSPNGLVMEEESSPSTRVCKPRLSVPLEGLNQGSAVWRKGPGSSAFTPLEDEAVLHSPGLALESLAPPSPSTAASWRRFGSLRSPVGEGRPRKRPAPPPVAPLPFSSTHCST